MARWGQSGARISPETDGWCSGGSGQRQSFLSQCRKNPAWGRGIEKKGFMRTGRLGGKRVLQPENLVGHSFITKGEVGWGEDPLSLS